MTTRLKLVLLCACLAWLFNGWLHAAEPPKVIELWPGTAPGDTGDIGKEHDTTKPTDNQVAGKPVVRLGNISVPTLTLYRPAPDKDTGVAVMVCPGGGYNILAMDLEGTEVCEWLNSLGITGALLKYRVPKRPSLEKHVPALQDAQRGLGLLRFQSRAYGFDPKRIGVIGFSAGGHLAAALSNIYDHRTYPTVDEVDAASCRPDFTLLVYPAYLTIKEENDKIAPELNITSNTPPTFIAMAEDDPVRVETGLFYAAALRKSKVPFELHVYPVGGHGYGLRPTQDLVTTWPRRAAEWMRSQGWLSRHSGER
ncbi:MAG: alpha/beta hydrolase [Limisphaerales bacterium]